MRLVPVAAAALPAARRSPPWIPAVVGPLVLGALLLTSRHNYLLFHSLAEGFSILIAGGVFIVAWNARRVLDNHYFLLLGSAYLVVAGVDLLHTIAYKGMGVFAPGDGNLPTQLWMLARGLHASAVLLAPLWIRRRLNMPAALAAYGAVTALGLLALFAWDVFPDCFVEGQGLTPFKIAGEYVVAGSLALGLAWLARQRGAFDQTVRRWVIASAGLMIAAELAFTLYFDVYGAANLVGHLFKIAAFYCAYKAIIEIGLVQPYTLLFWNLRQSQQALLQARAVLETRVAERTAALTQANQDLQQEIAARRQAEAALSASEARFRTLTETTSAAIFIVQDGCIRYANTAAQIITGYPASELMRMRLADLLHPAYRDAVERFGLANPWAEHLPARYELRLVTHAGETRWVDVTAGAMAHEGQPAHVVTAFDITDRDTAEKALQAARQAVETERQRRLSP